MSEWKKVKIKDVCTGIYDGPHATPPVSNTGGIYLGISNITADGHIDLRDTKYISEDDLPKWTKRVVPKKGDIVFSYEATLNLYAIIPENFHGCLGRRMALIRVDDCKASNLFLYYYFFSKEWRSTIATNTIIGATVDRIPIAKFPDFQISIPPLETQHRIAEILSRYDTLIENYQKQIKLLEEAAQRLYKEWFVELRFPGHENVKVVDGLPERWERKSVSQLGEYLNGFAFKPSDWQEKGKPIIKIKEMGNGVSDETPRNNGERVPAKYLVKAGDLIFSWSATLMVIIWTGEEGWLNQHLFKVTPAKGIGREFLLQTISNAIIEFSNLTTGSTMKHIQRNKLDQVFVNVPNDEIMELYNNVTKKVREEILHLSSQIRLLTEARDRLLPRLMGGEMEA